MKTMGLVVLVLIAFANTAIAGDLVLRAPAQSQDGSYILQLEASNSRHFDSLELYRSVNGSDYELLVTVPLFKAISQMVNQNGVYAYKIRGITSEGLTEMSEPVFVEVEMSKSGRPQARPKHRISGNHNHDAELTLGAR